MIQGQFDQTRQPTLTVDLAGPYGSLTLTVGVDTGFDGHLCIPIPAAVTLGLSLKTTTFVELADGSIHEELVFRGEARLGDAGLREVEVQLTHSEQGLIGSGLFQGMKLEIDYGQETVILRPSGATEESD